MIFKSLLFILFILPFGVPFLGDVDIFSAMSLQFFRDCLLFCYIILLFLGENTLKKDKKVKKKHPIWLQIYLLLVFYIIISCFFSVHSMLILPLVFRLFIVGVVTLLVTKEINTIRVKDILNVILISICIYFSISLIQYFGFNGSVLEGPSGQHYSKFLALTGVLVSLSCYLENYHKRISAVSFVLSFFSGILCLQRGFLISSAFGFVVILFYSRISLKRKIVINLVFISICLFIGSFFIDRIIEYSFFANYGPDEIMSSISDGKFDIGMIRTRGRLELVEIICKDMPISFFGEGAGSVKYRISEIFWTGKEPHNDILMLFYDFGIFFMVGLFGFSISFLSSVYKISKSKNREVRICSVASIALFTSLLVWMTFSNVIVYSLGGFVYAILLGGISYSIYSNKNKKI